MTHIQYQGETLPPSLFPPSSFHLSPFPLVLAFHLVLGKFHIYFIATKISPMLLLSQTSKVFLNGSPRVSRFKLHLVLDYRFLR